MLSKVWPIATPGYRAPQSYFPPHLRWALARSVGAFARAVTGQGSAIGAASLDRHVLKDIGIEHPCRAKSVVQASDRT